MMSMATLYVVFSIFPCYVLCTQLTIEPLQIRVGGDNPTLHLNGSCSPPGGATTCYTITIGRQDSSGNKTIMVQIADTINNNKPTIEDTELRPRLLVSVDVRASKTLHFSLREPSEADAGVFYCQAQFVPASAGGTEDTVNINAIVSPTTSTTSTTSTGTSPTAPTVTTKDTPGTMNSTAGVSQGSGASISIGLMTICFSLL